MIEAMVLGGLRRSEVLGLRLEDLRSPQRRVFIADGKGGHQRWVPISPRFFASVSEYLRSERPTDAATDRVFVVLKGPHRGRPLTAKGLEQIMRGARVRAGLTHGTCHELRHTCLTRLREAGMALEAIQAQAGHRSIESTRIYLHLADDWVAGEYRKAIEAIDAQARVGSGVMTAAEAFTHPTTVEPTWPARWTPIMDRAPKLGTTMLALPGPDVGVAAARDDPIDRHRVAVVRRVRHRP